MQNTNATTALLAISSHCPNCPAVIRALTGLVKSGELASLQIINLEANPETAATLGIRSVPWVRLGDVELVGLRSEQEYREWLGRAGDEAQRDSLGEMLASGDVARVLERVSADNSLFAHLLALMADGDERINVRLGIGVIMEEFAATAAFAPWIGQLAQHLQSADARVRADAAHYLGLTGDDRLKGVLQALLDDQDAEVREVAADSIALLAGEQG